MPISLNAYGAGLSHGSVKTADGNVYDIDAIVSAEGDPQIDDIQVNGDDLLKATFYFNRREELSIVANGISFDVIQAITGNTVSSSATGLEVALGTTSEDNPPFVEIRADTIAKDSLGASVTITKTWHRVQIGIVKLSQSNGSEFNIELTGVAYTTDKDIEGGALSTQRIATIEVQY